MDLIFVTFLWSFVVRGKVEKEYFTSALCEGWVRPGVLSRATDVMKATLERYALYFADYCPLID